MSISTEQSSAEVLLALKSIVPANKKLIVAVSGGVDSTALLIGLNALKLEQGLNLTVAHVNHLLREGSDQDASFVQKLAKRLDLQFDLKVCHDPPTVNIESWARRQRYGFFKDLLGQYQADYLVTAHHAGDLVETLLIKLLQNRELNLMRPRDDQRKLLRPFLGVSKKDLENFLIKQDQPYVEDSSNRDNQFLRNRVRNQLLPFLDNLNSTNAAEVLKNQALVIDELNRLADQKVRGSLSAFDPIKLMTPWSPDLVDAILGLSKISWLLAAKAIDQVFLPVYGFYLGRKIADRVVRVLSGIDKSVNLPDDKCLIWINGRLLWKSQKDD